MAIISDEQVVEKLASIGASLENFFLFPIERLPWDGDEEPAVIGFWIPEIGFRYLILEKDDLARAAKQYLKKRGARVFAPEEDVWEVAFREKWPGWDTCADVVRDRERARERESAQDAVGENIPILPRATL